MFRRFRRILLVTSVISALTCVVVLANFTAPNPTGRRYSSRPVSRAGGSMEIGTDGEQALAADLRMIRNDMPDQRVCFCNGPYNNPYYTPNAADCRTCVAYYQGLTASYRRIDFINDAVLAEAKNRQSMPIGDKELLNQIGDYALVAKTLGRPLWLYTRVDTVIDADYVELVQRTGGGVVRYFAYPGYEDSADYYGKRGLAASGAGVGLALLMGVRMPRRRSDGRSGTQWTASGVPPTPKSPKGRDPLGKAIDSVEHADDHAAKSKQNFRDKLDR